MKKFISALMCCVLLIFAAVPAFAWTEGFYDDLSSGDLEKWEDSAGLSVNSAGYAVLGTFNKLLVPSLELGAEDIRVSFDADAWGDNNLYMQFFNIEDTTDFFRIAIRVPADSSPFVEFTDWGSSVKANASGSDTWTRNYSVAAKSGDIYAKHAEFTLVGGTMNIKFIYTDDTEKEVTVSSTDTGYGVMRPGVKYGVAFYSYAVSDGSTKIKNVKIETLDQFKAELKSNEIDIQPGSKLNVKFNTDTESVSDDMIQLLKSDDTAVSTSLEKVSDSEYNVVLGDDVWLTQGDSLTLSINGVKNASGQKISAYKTAITAKTYDNDYTVGRAVLKDSEDNTLDKLGNGKTNVTVSLLPSAADKAGADVLIALCSGTEDKYRIEDVWYYTSVKAFETRSAEFDTKEGQFIKVMSFDGFNVGTIASPSLIIGR